MPGLENQNIASGTKLDLSVRIKYSSAGVVDLHFGVTFYRREQNTGKGKITVNHGIVQFTICMHDQVIALKISPRQVVWIARVRMAILQF